jgi:osmotically-inducible protein OsmY
MESGAADQPARRRESHTNFTSYNRKVLITGEVASEQTRQKWNGWSPPTGRSKASTTNSWSRPASFGTRSNDSYITTKVKSRFVDSGKFNAVYVKVVTENGVVYLLGLVTQREADAAIQVARTTTDVKKVVTLSRNHHRRPRPESWRPRSTPQSVKPDSVTADG